MRGAMAKHRLAECLKKRRAKRRKAIQEQPTTSVGESTQQVPDTKRKQTLKKRQATEYFIEKDEKEIHNKQKKKEEEKNSRHQTDSTEKEAVVNSVLGVFGTKRKETFKPRQAMKISIEKDEKEITHQTDGMQKENVVNSESGVLDRPSPDAEQLDIRDASVPIKTGKFIVHVSRLEEVEKARQKLPIIMMEQEIMEAITDNSVTIICGETGCGKTTQVPQFLYEAGFSSSSCLDKSGMIGVTQPRRVAVLTTAKRVSHELNVILGHEVGFQVRHDRNVGKNTRIKFMTDGILLREVQSDFLLRRYSVIILDEAHERSLNTDILIGMLSRILRLRQTLFEEQGSLKGAAVFPLKLVIMSATLSIDDFVSNRKIFLSPPPVIQVPTSQFPVTIHFAAKTELLDYVGKAYKKVCLIHRKLPPGGVLVFLTGQAEVNHLCRRLQRTFPKGKRKQIQNLCADGGKSDMELEACAGNGQQNIIDVAEVNYMLDDPFDDTEALKVSDTSIDTESESAIDFAESGNVTNFVENVDTTDRRELHEQDLDAIKAAFNAFTGEQISDASPTGKQGVNTQVIPGPLYVLPLYAMLPAASQLKVFGTVPEGSRLVVATNVAETSITIPGIRYVVDCGRAKENVYEHGSGITRYMVCWISKSSAAQRAGRAGRTGPGQCYRLYSSSVFNDAFPEVSLPEISRSPIENVVLLLKSLGIIRVKNFPFPSQPDEKDLMEAEQCLLALSALDPKSGLLTPLGLKLSLYPIGPRHARLLLTAMHIGWSEDITELRILLVYAAAVASALSLDNPFIMQANDKDVPHAYEKTSSRRKSMPHKRFQQPLSDVLRVVLALRAYEASGDREEFCVLNCLHSNVMHEMSKLRKQLIRVYLAFNEEHFKGSSSVGVDALEAAWENIVNQGFSMKQEHALRQAICAGWADRVAHKVNVEAIRNKRVQGEHHKVHVIQYQSCTTSEEVFLHPLSGLRKMAPQFVVYNELVHTSRPYMKLVTSIDACWLVMYAKALCTFSKPLMDPPPYYDACLDDVYCWVSVTFGQHLWELPQQRQLLTNSKQGMAVFAYALLQGKVLPSIAELRPHLTADPSIIMTPVGLAHKRVSEMLHALGVHSICNRRKLKAVWDSQPDLLFQELLLWVQKSFHEKLQNVWPRLRQEAGLTGRDLFGRQERVIEHI